MIRGLFRFLGKVISTVVKTAVTIVKNIVCNIEAVTILSMASIGTAAVLTELPYHFAVPAIMESAMFIPVISVLFIIALLSIMELRMSFSPRKYY